MKTMKVALLATAALAAVSVSARADDAAAIKAQLEALNARIAQLEAAPAAPVGYSMLTISEGSRTVVPGVRDTDKNYSDTATIIGIMPTADAPASTTVEWTGYVRAIVAHTSGGYYDESPTNVWGRAQLSVTGKTDTAVGEVGARVQFRSSNFYGAVDGDDHLFTNEYWGWWAMTPELTFGGGYTGSLGNVAFGQDGACTCNGTDWWTSEQRNDIITVTPNPGDTQQVRLSYSSGPLSAAIALEDSSYHSSTGGDNWGDLGVAGEIAYAGDTVSGEISAIFYEHSSGNYDNDGWQVAAGLGFALGDMATLSLSAATGDNPDLGDYWLASALVGISMTDTVRAEVAASYADYSSGINEDITEVIAGIYYEPVSQLTLGIEGDWASSGQFDEGDFTTFNFVSVWRF